jgi:hypothetical protein
MPFPAAAVPANQADVVSPDAIIAAAYDVISGPATQKRDWDRMRSLFYPGARLIRTAPKKEGGMGATSFSTQDYIDRASVYFEKNGFSEKEVGRHTEKWGTSCKPSVLTNRDMTRRIPLLLRGGSTAFNCFSMELACGSSRFTGRKRRRRTP